MKEKSKMAKSLGAVHTRVNLKDKKNGITLVSLVVTIIILLILAGISISLISGSEGILGRATGAVDKNEEATATEKMEMKITYFNVISYGENTRKANLQELAEGMFQDKEIEYVKIKEQKVASLEAIDVTGESSIFVKLKEYPYEFEINEALHLVSVDGVKMADSENTSKVETEVGQYVLYKNNTFKITRIIGNAITMVCIPDSNTPTLQMGYYRVFETCEGDLNNTCRNYFADEELGIKAEDIYNARKTDYDNGWLEVPNDTTTPYWLASGYIRDNGKAYIYLYYMERNSGLSGKLTHIWAHPGGGQQYYTLSICPIITCNLNLLRLNDENRLYIK